jgi:hypothetical protein
MPRLIGIQDDIRIVDCRTLTNDPLLISYTIVNTRGLHDSEPAFR